MQINVSPEVILSQLGYSKSDSSILQAEKMMLNTNNFDKFSKHIFSLNDNLKKMNAYVGLSNKTSYLKIKCDENDADQIINEFHKEVGHWSNKYNVQVEQLDKKPIYYIIGTN
jgi:hypothetical protein